MESINKYNISNKTITVKDALRAIAEGEFKVSFEKVPQQARPGVINLKPKFEIGGNLVNQFKFTCTRFWSLKPMSQEVKEKFNIQKEKIEFVGTRKMQQITGRGNQWKRAGSGELFDFIDAYAKLYSNALLQHREGDKLLTRVAAPETKFGIKQVDYDLPNTWHYKIRAIVYPGRRPEGIPDKIGTKFYDVSIKEENGKVFLTRGDSLLPKDATVADVYNSPLGGKGLYVAWGIFRGGQVAVHSINGLMGHGFELIDCYVLNDCEEDVSEFNDIERSLALDSVDSSLREVIEKSKALKLSQETASSEGSGDLKDTIEELKSNENAHSN